MTKVQAEELCVMCARDKAVAFAPSWRAYLLLLEVYLQ
jgi:hypothetical protein